MPCFFFKNDKVFFRQRGKTGPGIINPANDWGAIGPGWKGFGSSGIDAALYANTKAYIFSGDQYIRVTVGGTGDSSRPDWDISVPDAGYPKPISDWNFPKRFSLIGGRYKNGIDAVLTSGDKCYFFAGNIYIRVTRTHDEGAGDPDPGYPKLISDWNWPNGFAVGGAQKNGIDAALWSGEVCYFFAASNYIRVHRGDEGPGTVDHGYPQNISAWQFGPYAATGIDAAINMGIDQIDVPGADNYQAGTTDDGDVGSGDPTGDDKKPGAGKR
jgi:Hemopexin